ncbi:unnamed protein product [Tuber aestivum]|uniref:Origin recognition complex subunit 4 C-terminal domain-containing protein n=1 Tax=Tuber aestivum TaxID=59557 RepID=A0A292PQ28_9PEZI|nr:unnamed protein product [Tuber aestivum]
MPPKRKAPGSAKASSAKRARTAAGTQSPNRPAIGDSIAVLPPVPATPSASRENAGSAAATAADTTAKRTRNSSKKDGSATPGSAKLSSRRSTLTPRIRGTPRRKRDDDAVAEEVLEGEGGAGEDEEEPGAGPSAEPTDKRTDPFDAPSSSGDELSKDQPQVPKPSLGAKAKSRRPKITYKTRKPVVQVDGSDDEISTTRSSPVLPAKKVVPAPVTPATTIKPRSRPPRTQRKRALPAPENLGVAPVAPIGHGSEEATPSAGKKGVRASAARKKIPQQTKEDDIEEEEEKEEVGDGEDEESDEMVAPPEEDVDGEHEIDEDFVATGGTIVTSGQSARALRKEERESAKKRLSFMTPAKETMATLVGLEDPFASERPKRTRVEIVSENMVASDPAADAIPDADLEQFPVESIQRLKKRVMPKLMGRKRTKLVGVLDEEGAISDLTEEHKGEFLTVRLNGFFQTDDKIALREIWRQLDVGMELDEGDQPKATNFADTLSSILAILSHPDELRAPDGEAEEPAQEDPSSTTTTLSVIFILEEFDLFATHPRQTLLYNLFDIAQSRKAPIAAIGTTTRIDVVESLEKRVKSRFSHRTVHLKNPPTLKGFWEICKEGLSVDMDEVDSEINGPSDEDRHCFEAWNSHIENLYNNDRQFQRHLRRIYAQNKDPKSFFNSCILPLSSSTTSFPTGPSFSLPANQLGEPDSILSILDGLTDLELTLLIAAARLDIISDTDTCNFQMAYSEYTALTSSLKVTSSATGVTAGRLWSKEVALGAWERLAEYELLVPVVISGGSGGGVSREGRMWRVEVGLAEIGKCLEMGRAGVGRAGLGKWCKEV